MTTATTMTKALPRPRGSLLVTRAATLVIAAAAVGSVGLWVPMANNARSALPAGVVEVAPAQPAPTLDVTVDGDPSAGWTLAIATENFDFQSDGRPEVEGRPVGHAHVHVNGEKVGMSWFRSFHIGRLPPGRNEVRVTLNTPTHEAFVVAGGLLSRTLVIEVGQDQVGDPLIARSPAPTAEAMSAQLQL